MPITLFFFLLGTGLYFLLMLLMGALFAGGIYMYRRGSKSQGQINEARRAFLGGGDDDGDHALFFGMQLVIQIFGSDELRARLARIISAEETSAQDKRRTMKSLASLLAENQYAWEYGYWEFQSDAETAISTFSQWRNEIEASMATEADEMGTTADRLQRFSDSKEYLIVSLMMLLDNRDEPIEDDAGDIAFRPTYEQLAGQFRGLCENFDESEYWRPQTFERLLEGVRAIDPRSVERDGIYVYPGTEADGISSFDLISDEGWKYLTDHSIRS